MCCRPITVRVESSRSHEVRYIDAPCGSCVDCLKRRQNDWKLRLCEEASIWSSVYFFTLTYRNSSLPCSVYYRDCASDVLYTSDYDSCCDFVSKQDFPEDFYISSTAYKKHIQDWLKRFRISFERKHGYKPEFRYFITSEYGPNPLGTKRPHYHGIIFCNMSKYNLKPLFYDWDCKYGIYDLKRVGIKRKDRSSVANYVSKYCAKGCFESRIEDINNGMASKAFLLCSKNIGASFFDKHANDYYKLCPESLKLDADFTRQDVERFFSHPEFKGSVYEKEINALCNNLYCYDGDDSEYKYKIPRYYYDRLFRKRIYVKSYKTLIKNGSKRLSRFESFKVAETYDSTRFKCFALAPEIFSYEGVEFFQTRFVSENYLSNAIAYCLQLRSVAREQLLLQNVSESEDFYMDESGSIRSQYQDSKRAARKARESLSTSSLQNFYNSNMWRHRSLDFEPDSSFCFTL